MNRCEIIHIPFDRIVEYPPKSGAFRLRLKKNWRDNNEKGIIHEIFEEADCIAYYQARRLTKRTFDENGKVDFTDLFICVDLCDRLGRKLKGLDLDNLELIYKKGFIVHDEEKETEYSFVRFEASGNMTRAGRLMFVCESLKEHLKLAEAITMLKKEEEPAKCSISKWLSYKGLALSSGVAVDGICTWESGVVEYLGADIIDRVIVVEDCIESHITECITSDPDDESCKRLTSVDHQQANWFDGAGLISIELVERIRKLKDDKGTPLFNDSQFTSIQFRMPFCKGMLHAVDFKRFFKEIEKPGPVEKIKDVWDQLHEIDDVDIILTKSQFKAYQWFENLVTSASKGKEKTWEEYRKRFKQYEHRLFITGQNKTDAERGEATQLTYQMLSTLSLDDAAVRDLVREAHQPYWQLRTDDEAKFLHFIDVHAVEEPQDPDLLPDDDKPPITASESALIDTPQVVMTGLNTNARLIRETQVNHILHNAAYSIKKKAAAGKLFVSGKMRYLCPDLLRMMYFIAGKSMKDVKFPDGNTLEEWAYKQGVLGPGRFFAPGIPFLKDRDKTFSITRSPHVAVNEHVVADVYVPKAGRMYEYFPHLEGVCMINPRDFFAERMGGADFDGDWVRLVHNPKIVTAAKKGLFGSENKNISTNRLWDQVQEKNGLALPWIKISAPKPNDDNNTVDKQWETLKRSLNSRVGEFSNIAYVLSAMAYGYYPKDDEEHIEGCEKKCAELLERMVMFIGREIDRVKTGAKVANVPKEKDYKEYLRRLGRENDFLAKKDYLLKRKKRSKKDKESSARHFLNKLEDLFKEQSESLEIKENFRTVPLSQLIKNSDRIEKVANDKDKMRRLIALLLAYNALNKAIYYGFYADIDEDDLGDGGGSGIVNDGVTTNSAVNEETADNENKREHHFLTRIIRILTEQGCPEPEATAKGIAACFYNAELSKLEAMIKSSFWVLTPKSQRKEKLEEIVNNCGVSKKEVRPKEFADILCDFSLGGYNLLGYVLRYAKWRKLSKDICTQLTLEGLDKVRQKVANELQWLKTETPDSEEIKKEIKNLEDIFKDITKKQAYYKTQFGDSATEYGDKVKQYFVDLRNAHQGKKKNIKSRCKEIAAEIFAGKPRDVVYAAMHKSMAKYDQSHAFFWVVAGEEILKHRLLVDFNKDKGFMLPSPETANNKYKKARYLHLYCYLYKYYMADERRIE